MQIIEYPNITDNQTWFWILAFNNIELFGTEFCCTGKSKKLYPDNGLIARAQLQNPSQLKN